MSTQKMKMGSSTEERAILETTGKGRFKRIGFVLIVIAALTLIIPSPVMACTVFYVKNSDGRVLVGRNFDGEKRGGRVWFIPSNIKTYGVAIFEQMGVEMPYEGINDQGLFIGVAAVPSANVPFSIFKPQRKSLQMVKIVLEHAQSVDEALRLFQKYSVNFGTLFGNPLIHYMIVDKGGNAAIVEYIDNQIIVSRGAIVQIMTNHYIANPALGSDSKTSFKRYDLLKDRLSQTDYSVGDIQELLKVVSQKTTIYSNVYDLQNQIIYIAYQQSKPVKLDLKNELYTGAHGYDLENLERMESIEYRTAKSNFLFRPHFGFGTGISYYGGRLLLSASDTKRYGLDVTRFNGSEGNFVSIGVILEQRLFEWFNMSIGTVGYFNKGSAKQNLAGLTSNLGWEPDNHIPFKPFVTYRTDMIFSQPVEIIHSVNFGLAFDF